MDIFRDLEKDVGSADAATLDVKLDSPAIARLIEEVRGTDFEVTRAYNRTYNRHNR